MPRLAALSAAALLAATLAAGCGSSGTAPTGKKDAARPDAASKVDAPVADSTPAHPEAHFMLPEHFTFPDGVFSTVDSGYFGDVVSPTTFSCGTIRCDKSTQICCVDTSTGMSTCMPTGSTCSTSATCNGAADCTSGDLCCGQPNSSFSGYTVTCQPSPCPSTFGAIQLCYTSAECPSGQFCCTRSYGGYTARICGTKSGTCY